jgi:hypothetical protein
LVQPAPGKIISKLASMKNKNIFITILLVIAAYSYSCSEKKNITEEIPVIEQGERWKKCHRLSRND